MAVIVTLQSEGYHNIVIGDGTSSGFLNAGINVIRRLKLDVLTDKLGVTVEDFNQGPYVKRELDDGQEIQIAQRCMDCDFFINLPKLKTHAEAGMSAAMKNLMGCVVGLDKQKIHRNLSANILNLNRLIEPDLHIVDAIIAMEGTGPSRGKPVAVNTILTATDGLLVDLVAARLAGMREHEVGYLRLARQRGDITKGLESVVVSVAIGERSRCFERPSPGLLGRAINHPRYRRFFAMLRYAPLFYEFLSSQLLSRPLFWLGARQDMFTKQDSSLAVKVNKGCKGALLDAYCPMGLKIADEVGGENCIQCLYCYFVSEPGTMTVTGTVGHLGYQLKHYRALIRQAVQLSDRPS